MARSAILTSLILLSFLFPISSPVISTESIEDAVEILSDAGYVSMSLTLHLVSKTLISQSSSSPLTIFAPSDKAFKDSGQPPLSLVKYHFSPLKFSIQSLKNLPFGTKIPTLFEDNSIIATSLPSDQQISINNVTLLNNGSPLYDVGSLVVYGIDDFLDPAFQVSTVEAHPPVQTPIATPTPATTTTSSPSNLGCGVSGVQIDAYHEVTDTLLSTQYSMMGEFLYLQLLKIGDQTDQLTIFAPEDEELSMHLSSFSDYGSIFRRHVVPCKLTWSDLENLEEGTELPTYLEGYTLKITQSGDILAVNGVPVVSPEVYSNNTVVVHGIGEMLDVKLHGEVKASPPGGGGGDGGGVGGDHSSEFHSTTEANTVLDYVTMRSPLQESSYCAMVHPNGTPAAMPMPLEDCMKRSFSKKNNITNHHILLERLSWINDRDMNFYGMDELFDRSPPVFSWKFQRLRLSDLDCEAKLSSDCRKISGALKGMESSFMASFFDMQLRELGDDMKLTVFAPVEEMMDGRHLIRGLFYEQSSEYAEHIVPCKLSWEDLVKLDNGTELPTLDKGFNYSIRTRRYGEMWLLNDVFVLYPDLYSTDKVVIHGLEDVEDHHWYTYDPEEIHEPDYDIFPTDFL